MAYSKRAFSNRVRKIDKQILTLILIITNFLLDMSTKICSYFERFLISTGLLKNPLISVCYKHF